MKTLSKALARGTIATVAAGALAATSTPAMARDHRDNDGIGAGEIIAGALIIGGIAAVAASANRGTRYDDRYRYDNRRGNSRQAVEQCVRAAERAASRSAYRGGARVTDIRDINRKRDGYEIKGRIAVNTRSNDWRRGWGNDWRGYDSRYSGYDSGKFTCRIRYGRVDNLRFSGIRGLR